MKTRKFWLTVIFLLVLTGVCYPAAKKSSQPDNKARNIYALFTEANPGLSQESAKKYAEYVIEAAEKFKQDSYVIAAIIVHESTVNNKALSKGGDYGLMQVRWKIHEKAIKQRFPKVKKAKDIFDVKRVNNDTEKGLMRYSAGSTKLRDKVMATVKTLRAKDNAAKTIEIQKQKQKNKKGK